MLNIKVSGATNWSAYSAYSVFFGVQVVDHLWNDTWWNSSETFFRNFVLIILQILYLPLLNKDRKESGSYSSLPVDYKLLLRGKHFPKLYVGFTVNQNLSSRTNWCLEAADQRATSGITQSLFDESEEYRAKHWGFLQA